MKESGGNLLERLRMRIRAWLHRDHVERELDEEVRYHLDKLIEENLAAGMTPAQARAAALKSFGGIEQAKEECRDARGTRMFQDLVQDLRFAARTLRRSPGFTCWWCCRWRWGSAPTPPSSAWSTPSSCARCRCAIPGGWCVCPRSGPTAGRRSGLAATGSARTTRTRCTSGCADAGPDVRGSGRRRRAGPGGLVGGEARWTTTGLQPPGAAGQRATTSACWACRPTAGRTFAARGRDGPGAEPGGGAQPRLLAASFRRRSGAGGRARLTIGGSRTPWSASPPPGFTGTRVRRCHRFLGPADHAGRARCVRPRLNDRAEPLVAGAHRAARARRVHGARPGRRQRRPSQQFLAEGQQRPAPARARAGAARTAHRARAGSAGRLAIAPRGRAAAAGADGRGGRCCC